MFNFFYIVRLGETYLKGKNKPVFENKIIVNIKNSVPSEVSVKKSSGLFLVYSEKEILENLKKIFGISSISPALRYEIKTGVNIENIITDISKKVVTYLNDKKDLTTFKVIVKRRNKKLKFNSTKIASLIGEKILESFPELKVDLIKPKQKIYIDLREDEFFIFTDIIEGVLGLSINSNGSAVSLLSGGIDSPVSTFLMMRRGMKVYPLHFYSYPYTSLNAKEKIISLTKKLAEYSGTLELTFINLLPVQEEIKKNAPDEMITLLTRRAMLKIALVLAKEKDSKGIITGDSLGQVASQTIDAIYSISDNINFPIFRPLIGLEKTEIIEYSKNIGTFDISIEPFEDCCTVFLPKKPLLKPKIEDVKNWEEKIKLDALTLEVFKKKEILLIKPN